MDLINKYEFSLGLEPYDVLGFESEEQLNNELQELIQPRQEFKNNFNQIRQLILFYFWNFQEPDSSAGDCARKYFRK